MNKENRDYIKSTCPMQCDCDVYNEYRRALCEKQNIVTVDIGVPTSVEIYDLNNNLIYELDNFVFKDLGYTNIIDLNLSSNLIFWIGIHAFLGLTKLRRINLSHNRLEYLTTDLFSDNIALEHIDLSGNMFQKMKNEPILLHANLKILNLSNCRIASLPERTFVRLPNVEYLDLSENYMITCHLKSFISLKKLKKVNLNSNPWACDIDFNELQAWLLKNKIQYETQCKSRIGGSKMFEKIISVTNEEPRTEIDLEELWGIDKNSKDVKKHEEKPKKPGTFDSFNKNVPPLLALIAGLQIGLILGIFGTYVWLSQSFGCRMIKCILPRTRRQLRRERAAEENEMRINLLWNSLLQASIETPPINRRQPPSPTSTPRAPMPLPRTQASPEVNVIGRSETPPPAYDESMRNN